MAKTFTKCTKVPWYIGVYFGHSCHNGHWPKAFSREYVYKLLSLINCRMMKHVSCLPKVFVVELSNCIMSKISSCINFIFSACQRQNKSHQNYQKSLRASKFWKQFYTKYTKTFYPVLRSTKYTRKIITIKSKLLETNNTQKRAGSVY